FKAATLRQAARDYLDICRKAPENRPSVVVDWLRVAAQRRKEIAAAEPSQNPRGTILEPGFRVIFPRDALGTRPGQVRLNVSNGTRAPCPPSPRRWLCLSPLAARSSCPAPPASPSPALPAWRRPSSAGRTRRPTPSIRASPRNSRSPA